VDTALEALRAAARSESQNTYGPLVDATRTGATQGEIIAVLRDELGFGRPLVVA
jgi:methylmalonyl-CoA mutase N-terminal domain/subunit